VKNTFIPGSQEPGVFSLPKNFAEKNGVFFAACAVQNVGEYDILYKNKQ